MMGKIATTVLIFVFSAGLAYPNQSVTITAIKSKGIPAHLHQVALSGFRDRLDAGDIDVRIIEHDLKEQDNLSGLLQEIKSKKPDLILTLGTGATRAAKDNIKDIPVVFTMVLNPARSGISGPGVSMDIPYETILKNLKKVLPGKVRVGVVYSPQSSSLYKEVSQANRKLGFKLVGKKIDSEKEFPKAIKTLSQRIDCFLMLPDPKIYFPKSVQYLLCESLKRKFPTIGLSSAYTRAGALISFDCDYGDLGEQTADLALEILAPKEPSETKVIRPRRVRYSLNLLVAERLGIKIPSKIVKQASEVFGK